MLSHIMSEVKTFKKKVNETADLDAAETEGDG